MVGYSGGKDSTLVAALVFDTVMSIPAEQRTNQFTIEARRELLTKQLKLKEEVGLNLISDDELFLILQLWKSARRTVDGGGVVLARPAHAGAQGVASWVGDTGDVSARVRVQADDVLAGDNRWPGDGAAVAAVGGASIFDVVRTNVDPGLLAVAGR